MKRLTATDYHALAATRGYEWLDTVPPHNNNTSTRWRCPKGHEIESTYHNLFSKIGTEKGCGYCSRTVRITPADYHSLAHARGFTWTGEPVADSSTPTHWQCVKGHLWESSFQMIKRGNGCPHCSGKARKTITDYHKLAEEHGFTLVKVAANTGLKAVWLCQFGHEWNASYDNINRGRGCPHCYEATRGLERRLNATHYHSLAASRGFQWTGSESTTARTPTGWRCSQGHEWQTAYCQIKAGKGCPYCAKVAPKTEADFHSLAERRGFLWTGTLVNTQVKTGWRCSKGHDWEASYNKLLQGRGCPHCSPSAPLTPTDYCRLAEKFGFFWIGGAITRSSAKTLWQCQQGHQWEASYSNVSRGQGCPQCVDMENGQHASKPQRELCEMIGGELNKRVGRLSIDVALCIDGINIAVEYDCWYWHQGNEARDARRDQRLIAMGWRS